MSIQKLSHARLGVSDIDDALQFHVEVLGLDEIARDGETVYLGCGLDDNYDVALTPGGTGLVSMSFDVTSDEDLHHYAERLRDASVESDIATDGDPCVEKALRFTLPSGHAMELVVLKQNAPYLRVGLPKRRRNVGIAPVDVEHVTIHVTDGRQVVEFIRDVLDFKVSDVFEPAPGVWAATWNHTSDYHHDLATLPPGGEGATLHHLAWQLEGIDHMKRAADLLSHAEIPIEIGPGRHGIGSNLYTYFHAPGGNRYEFSAEMGRATNRASGPDFWSAEQFPRGFSTWGQTPPESFQVGS